MHRLKLLSLALLALALMGFLLWASAPDTPSQGQGLARVSAAQVSATGAEPASAPVAAATAPPLAIKTQAQAPGSATTPAASRPKPSMPELTRALEQVQRVQMAGREWSVLGTKDVVNSLGTQVVLVLRDEISGQLEYRQSALRVVLREGVDYEAFISALPNAKRLFVNPLYGEIGVDAAYIGAQYVALAGDPRVLRVHFIPIAVPARAR